MKKQITQDDRVLRHLEENDGITSWEAIKEYGITRLSAVIFRLRKEGHHIENEIVFARNRYDEPVHFVRYRLVAKILENEEEPWWKRIRFFM